jgi:hypothetical protein
VLTHAYIRVRKKERFTLEGISDEMACMVVDMFDKYQTALSIVEHERDAYKRATATEKSRRARSKPLATASFTQKNGIQHVWDQGWMELREARMAEIAARESTEQLAKQEEKARKQHEKEQIAIRNEQRKAQKKALAADIALQKKIAASSAFEDKARERAEKKSQKEAAKQLAHDIQATQKPQNTKKKPTKASNMLKEIAQVINDDDNGLPTPKATTSRGHIIRKPKHLDDN